jgi:protein phosphatase methylesterase 1
MRNYCPLVQLFSYSVKTNTIHNPISARVSIPSIMKPVADPPDPEHTAVTWRTPLRSTAPYWSCKPNFHEALSPFHLQVFSFFSARCDLAWFTGLSNLFLAVRSARLLVLAGTDRLDQPLMIGQMQGKFQLAVVPGDRVGHMLHEVRVSCLLTSSFFARILDSNQICQY